MTHPLRLLVLLMLALAAMGATNYAQAKKAPAVALYYQHNAPLEDLKVFDIVVVEPDHGYDPLGRVENQRELITPAAR